MNNSIAVYLARLRLSYFIGIMGAALKWTGYGLLIWASWKIALGVFLITLAGRAHEQPVK